MKVVCKENTKCDFVKTCTHSKLHEYNNECSYKNARCPDGCICNEDFVFKFERKTKLKKINETSDL